MVVGGKHKSAKSGSSSGPSAGPEELPAVDENKTRCPCGNSAEIGTMIQVEIVIDISLASSSLASIIILLLFWHVVLAVALNQDDYRCKLISSTACFN